MDTPNLPDPPVYDPSPAINTSKFQKELEGLLNKYSMENGSDTPDFILANYLTDCLLVFNKTLTWRERWYGRGGIPVEAPIEKNKS